MPVSGGVPPFSGAMMTFASDATTIDATSSPTVAWDTSNYDNGGWVDLANDRFVVPSGVTLVDITCHMRVSSFTASSVFAVFIMKGGVTTFPGHSSQTVTGLSTCDVHATALGVPVAAGDLITAVIFSSGDNSATLVAARSSFSIRKVA
jgi:hypothetical protein